MPKVNNNICRKRIQAQRKIMNKMGEKSDISLKKMNGNGKNTRERGFVAKLPKFNYDENGNTPVRKGGYYLRIYALSFYRSQNVLYLLVQIF